jgi:hypothetical protein
MMRTPVYGLSERHLQTFNHQHLRAWCALTSFLWITSLVCQVVVTSSAGSASKRTRSQSWKNTGSQSCVRRVLRKTLAKSQEVSCSLLLNAELNTCLLEAITGSLITDVGISQRYFAIFEELQLSCFSILLHCRK